MNDRPENIDVCCSNCDDSVTGIQNIPSPEKMKDFVKCDFWYVNYILITNLNIPKEG